MTAPANHTYTKHDVEMGLHFMVAKTVRLVCGVLVYRKNKKHYVVGRKNEVILDGEAIGFRLAVDTVWDVLELE
jgi:hypothetical protein